MVFSSYFIFNNRYKVSLFISFLLTSGLLILFSNIPVKEKSIKEKSIIITFTEEVIQEVIPEQSPEKNEISEISEPVAEVIEDYTEQVPISETVEEVPQEVEGETTPEDVPVSEAASKNLQEIVEDPTTKEINEPKGETIEDVKSEYIDIDSLPRSTVIVEPKYPKSAVKWSMEGTVEVEIIVLKTGEVSEISLLKSSGHKVLDNECIKTIKKKWKLPNLGYEYKIFKRFVFLLK